MRLFFGLKPGPQSALDIVSWRERFLPPMLHPVPVDNLHITLSFLGQVKEQQLEQLMVSAEQIQVNRFELNLDQLGFWSKPKILWIGPAEVPDEILQLVKLLTSLRRRLGLQADKSEYIPHISIARRCEIPPPAGIIDPEFKIHFDSFALFESTRTRSGMRYRPMQEWWLT